MTTEAYTVYHRDGPELATFDEGERLRLDWPGGDAETTLRWAGEIFGVSLVDSAPDTDREPTWLPVWRVRMPVDGSWPVVGHARRFEAQTERLTARSTWILQHVAKQLDLDVCAVR